MSDGLKDKAIDWRIAAKRGQVEKLEPGSELRQVEGGYAWHYKKYVVEQSDMDRRLYADAETDAGRAGRGLWQEPSPVPPWEWRRDLGERAFMRLILRSALVRTPLR